MKRFWDHATVVAEDDGGYSVRLDGRPVRLPGGTPLRVGSPAMAEAVAEEWNAVGGGAKGGEMRMEEVPMTRYLGTAQERIAPDPAPMVEGLAKYGETDLLCYRADEATLAARQAEDWQPILDWLALHHDAPLRVTLYPIAAAGDAAVRNHVASLTADDFGDFTDGLDDGVVIDAERIGTHQGFAGEFQ